MSLIAVVLFTGFMIYLAVDFWKSSPLLSIFTIILIPIGIGLQAMWNAHKHPSVMVDTTPRCPLCGKQIPPHTPESLLANCKSGQVHYKCWRELGRYEGWILWEAGVDKYYNNYHCQICGKTLGVLEECCVKRIYLENEDFLDQSEATLERREKAPRICVCEDCHNEAFNEDFNATYYP